MNWNLDKTRPICPQICECICAGIVSGVFETGERLLSVRDVALEAGVNPNTVQKSFEQLEASGIIYSIRGSGWYVSENTAAPRVYLNALITDRVDTFVEDMVRLGVDKTDIPDLVKEHTNG